MLPALATVKAVIVKDGRLKSITDTARMSITYQVAIFSTGMVPP
jgi:hypothetical protein